MHQIKQLPQDFIVKEISNVNIGSNGQYAYYILKKINYTTIDALQILSKKFSIPLKYFGFAGNKDKKAITEQKISIFKGKKNFENQRFSKPSWRGFENIKLSNIELKYLGNGKEPVSLGDLEGNEFTITIRNLESNSAEKIGALIMALQNKKVKVPNFYGHQRFSKNNHLAGKEIIKKDFKKAVELILENEGHIEDEIRHCLAKNKNDHTGAIRVIPLKTRKLFVHAYQSFLFNKSIDEYLKSNENNKIKNIKIPLIGFNFELNSTKNAQLRKILKKILEEEKISPRDFIISQIPELSSEGGFRDLFFDVKSLKILEIKIDELNQNKKKVKIGFSLPKSCYATVAAEHLFHI